MLHVETAVDVTRLQPLRTSAPNLEGPDNVPANSLDTVQLHSYIHFMPTPSRDKRLCYALAARKSARHLSRLYDSHLAPAGLSNSQFSILGLLEMEGRLKFTELADLLIMERTSLVRALKPLQASGWVVAERSESGRAFDVTLSPSGLKKLAEAKPLWAEAQAAFEGEVGRDRAIRFRDQILKLNLGG
jgi:DNA-binding MarR family transcriptional regulator